MHHSLKCASHDGSISRYYHFFFACLIPLIDFRHENPDSEIILFSDVGPFSAVLSGELPLSLSFGNESFESRTKISYLPAYDVFDSKYFENQSVPRMPTAVRDDVLSFIEKTKPMDISIFPSLPYLPEPPIIVLIERKGDVPLNTQSFKAASGASRRRIRNHQHLEQALRKKYGSSFVNIALEGMGIYAQYYLFSTASVVIGQHGAALSNIFFMRSIPSSEEKLARKPSHVVEISSPYSRRAKYFKNLASFCNVSFSSIAQERNLGNVSVTSVVNHVDCVLRNLNQVSTLDKGMIGKLCGDDIDRLTKNAVVEH